MWVIDIYLSHINNVLYYNYITMEKHWVYKDWNKRFATIYYHMRNRCNNINDTRYHDYWWRWIKCLWSSFQDFYEDMYEWYLSHCAEYWEKNTTIDRIDNNWNYCKDNCRRATRSEQDFNKRQSLKIKIDDIEYDVRDFARTMNISEDVARRRIKNYKKWNLPYEELIRVWLKQRRWLIVWWLYYTYEDIANITWATRGCIDTRVYRFRRGDINKAALFKKV